MLLKECGAELKRHKKHLVYRLKNGMNFVIASTPGDRNSRLNELTTLRRLCGRG